MQREFLNARLASLRSLTANSSIYVIGDAITRGLALVLVPVYTYFLTPAEYGILGIISSVIAVLNIFFTLQIGTAITVNYFQVEGQNRKGMISAVWLLSVLIAFVIGALFLATNRLWSFVVLPNLADYPYLYFAISISFFMTFAVIPQTLMRLREQSLRLVCIAVGVYFLGTAIGLVLLVVFYRGVRGIFWGMLISQIAGAIIYIFMAYREINLPIPLKWFKSVFIVTLPLVPHMIAHWSLNFVDRVILQAFVPLSEVGVYQLGYQFGMILQAIAIAVNNAWVPYFLRNLIQAVDEKIFENSLIGLFLVKAGLGLELLYLPQM